MEKSTANTSQRAAFSGTSRRDFKDDDNIRALRNRVEKLIDTFFRDIKGVLTFLGGLTSVNNLFGTIRGSKVEALDKITLLEKPIKDFGSLAGLTEIRKIFYTPLGTNNFSGAEERNYRQLVQRAKYQIQEIALPIIASIGFLIDINVISDKCNRCKSVNKYLSLAALCFTASVNLNDLVKSNSEDKPSRRADLIYRIAIDAFNWSMKNSSCLAKLASDQLRINVQIVDGLYKFTSKFASAWWPS